VPRAPGLLCASGDLVVDFHNEVARTLIRTIDAVSGDEVAMVLGDLADEARARM
jgi:hypothetical protein